MAKGEEHEGQVEIIYKKCATCKEKKYSRGIGVASNTRGDVPSREGRLLKKKRTIR